MTRQITSRDFNQNVSSAKRAAEDGPVVITDRGEPAFVLLRHAEYVRLTEGVTGQHRSIRAALTQRDVEDFEFTPPRVRGLIRDIDFD